jgi:hypothetical protein
MTQSLQCLFDNLQPASNGRVNARDTIPVHYAKGQSRVSGFCQLNPGASFFNNGISPRQLEGKRIMVPGAAG